MKTIQKFANALALGRLATAPSNSIDGTIYYDTTLNEFRIKKAGVWTSISSGGDLSNYYTKAEIDAIITGLTTDDIAEASNLYFTDARAKTAAVVDSLAGSQTDQAPSVSAVKTALVLKADETELANYLELAGGTMTGALTLSGAPTVDLHAATKKYVDDAIVAATPEAIDVSYDNVTSGLSAVNVQEAIDELAQEISTLPDPITYKGAYDAATNTPALSNADTNVTGFLYRVTVAGTVDFGAGDIELAVGDSVVNNGTVWEKWDHTDQVLSVNGQTGAVVLTSDDISEGFNLYFTEERVLGTELGAGFTPFPFPDPIEASDDILTAFSKAQAQIDHKLSGIVQDTVPELGADLNTGVFFISGKANPLKLSGSTGVRRSKSNPGSSSVNDEYVEEEFVPKQTIPTNPDAVVYSLSSEFGMAEIDVSIKGLGGERRKSTICIMKNSVNAFITESFSETAEFDIEFTAELNTGVIELHLANNIVSDIEIVMDVKKFLA